jgi:hypothetical protein
MADILRTVEFRDLVGHARRAELGTGTSEWGAYIDTGAGRTVVSSRVARSVRMPKAPITIEYTVPIKTPVEARMTAMRLVGGGCERHEPVLVAVSDKVIKALELPGVEVLIGQDYLEAARVTLAIAPKKTDVACRMEAAVRRTTYAERAAAFGRERIDAFRRERAQAVMNMAPEKVERRGQSRVLFPSPEGGFSVALVGPEGEVLRVLAEDVTREMAEKVARS